MLIREITFDFFLLKKAANKVEYENYGESVSFSLVINKQQQKYFP